MKAAVLVDPLVLVGVREAEEGPTVGLDLIVGIVADLPTVEVVVIAGVVAAIILDPGTKKGVDRGIEGEAEVSAVGAVRKISTQFFHKV